jgi:4-amino-4-deoxychorismate lyase
MVAITFAGERLHSVTVGRGAIGLVEESRSQGPPETAVPPVWYDGALQSGAAIALSPMDPALLYGATVFTTLRIYQQDLDHPATAWQAHCDRLHRSLHSFQWRQPDWVRVRQGAETLHHQGPSTHPVLRITLFPDGRELITLRALPSDLATRQRQGVTAWVAPVTYQRSLPDHKTGNYLSAWLALQAAQGQGAQEAILINAQGDWLETSTGNLWGWSAGQWYTPPLAAGMLPGVMRSQLWTGLTAQGHRVQEIPWTVELRKRLTHLAYSNSVGAIVPIPQVLLRAQSVNYNPDHGPILALWRALQMPPPEF